MSIPVDKSVELYLDLVEFDKMLIAGLKVQTHQWDALMARWYGLTAMDRIKLLEGEDLQNSLLIQIKNRTLIIHLVEVNTWASKTYNAKRVVGLIEWSVLLTDRLAQRKKLEQNLGGWVHPRYAQHHRAKLRTYDCRLENHPLTGVHRCEEWDLRETLRAVVMLTKLELGIA